MYLLPVLLCVSSLPIHPSKFSTELYDLQGVLIGQNSVVDLRGVILMCSIVAKGGTAIIEQMRGKRLAQKFISLPKRSRIRAEKKMGVYR
jgi:hypothetical protein